MRLYQARLVLLKLLLNLKETRNLKLRVLKEQKITFIPEEKADRSLSKWVLLSSSFSEDEISSSEDSFLGIGATPTVFLCCQNCLERFGFLANRPPP